MSHEEMILKAKQAKSVEELLALAKENDVEMDEEGAKECFDQLHRTGELSDEELDNVSGGGCYAGDGRLVVTCGHGCKKWVCKKCGHGLAYVRQFVYHGTHKHYYTDWAHSYTGCGFMYCPEEDWTCKNCRHYVWEGGLFLCNNPENCK